MRLALTTCSILLLLVPACSKPGKDVACPDDARLTGAAPPQGHEQWCQKENGQGSLVRHGVYRRWHQSGQIQSEETYVDGKLDGQSRVWHQNGQLLGRATFRDGVPTGEAITWHENGQKWHVKQYVAGRKEGASTVWNSAGRKTLETHYDNDVREGVETVFEADGSRLETLYEAGVEQWSKAYDADGKLIEAAANEPAGAVERSQFPESAMQ